MTARQMYDFACGQVAWHEQQVEWCAEQIALYGRRIKRARAEDRELAAYALKEEPDDPLTLRVFGGNYVSTETRRLINARAKMYRWKKYNTARAEHYKREAEHYGARMESRLFL